MGKGLQVRTCVSNPGVIVSVRGSVVDVRFEDCLTPIYSLLRAKKNIDGLLEELTRNFHRPRQSTIDEELFEVIAGYESLEKMPAP